MATYPYATPPFMPDPNYRGPFGGLSPDDMLRRIAPAPSAPDDSQVFMAPAPPPPPPDYGTPQGGMTPSGPSTPTGQPDLASVLAQLQGAQKRQQQAQQAALAHTRNLRGEARGGALTAGIIGALAALGGADPAMALGAAGTGYGAYKQAKDEGFANDQARYGATAKMYGDQAAGYEKLLPTLASIANNNADNATRTTIAEADRKARADLARVQSASELANSYPKFIDSLRSRTDITDLQRGQMAEQYQQTVAEQLGYNPFAPLATVRNGPGIPLTVTPQGALDAEGNYSDPNGQMVTDASNRHLAAPRPPLILPVSPTMGADTSDADKAEALAKQQAAKLAADGTQHAADAMAAWGRLGHSQQVALARDYNKTNGTAIPVPGEPSGQFHVVGGKQYPILNPDYTLSPEDQARQAQIASDAARAAYERTQTQLMPEEMAIKRQTAANSGMSASAALQNAGTNAARLGLERQKFQAAASKVTGKLYAGDPASWSPLQLQKEMTRISTPSGGRTVKDPLTNKTTFVPGPSPDSTDAGQQYKAGLQAILATKQSQASAQPSGANVVGTADFGAGGGLSPSFTGMGGDAGGFTSTGPALRPAAPPRPAPRATTTTTTSHSPINDATGANVPNNYRRPGYVPTPNNGDWVKAPTSATAPARPTAPVRVSGQADYNRLPKGALYIAPDGRTLRKS